MIGRVTQDKATCEYMTQHDKDAFKLRNAWGWNAEKNTFAKPNIHSVVKNILTTLYIVSMKSIRKVWSNTNDSPKRIEQDSTPGEETQKHLNSKRKAAKRTNDEFVIYPSDCSRESPPPPHPVTSTNRGSPTRPTLRLAALHRSAPMPQKEGGRHGLDASIATKHGREEPPNNDGRVDETPPGSA